MPNITPFLWFDNNVEEAMNFYTSIFKDTEVLNVARNGDQVFMASFKLQGQTFMALNGGPQFHFTEAISFFIDCTTQEEVDEFWAKLSEGGETSQCGWLKDKFGLSWQVVPKALGELMSGPDAAKSQRVMQAMLTMTKIEIKGLQDAYDQE